MVVTKEVTRGVFDPRTYREDDPVNWARKRRSDWLAVPGKIHFVRWRDLYFMLLYFKCLSVERELLTRTLLMMERRLLNKLLNHLLTEKWSRCHPRRSPSRAALETGSSPMTTGPGRWGATSPDPESSDQQQSSTTYQQHLSYTGTLQPNMRL